MIQKQEPPKRISVSQINAYLSCPRRFQFTYIKHLKEITRSAQLNIGTTAHEMIAKGQFDHPTDENIDGMLKIAQEFLAQYDPKEERLLEQKLCGTVCGMEAVGVFDVIYPNLAKGIDWKSGKQSPYAKISHDLQSYFYALLYEQNFNREINEIIFVFFGDNSVYIPKIQNDNFRAKCEKRVQDVISAAYCEDAKYPKKPSFLCGYCSYNAICEIFKE